MDIKLTITADASAMRFAELVASITNQKNQDITGAFEPRNIEVKAEAIEETKTVAVEEIKTETAQDNSKYADLRKQIKEEAIRIVKAKKRDQLKEINAKYNIAKVDMLQDDQLEEYLVEVGKL